MVFATLNSLGGGNARSRVPAIVALYQGLELDIKVADLSADRTAYKATFPQGLFPTLEKADGFKLSESVAISLYLAYEKDSTLTGETKEEAALVQQWTAWANGALLKDCIAGWTRPLIGQIPYNKAAVEAAKASALAQLAYLESHLADKTFLATERITVADIFAASVLQRGFETVLDAEFRAAHPNVTRFFNTVSNQPNYVAVAGTVTPVQKAITYTPPKKEPKPAAPAAAPKAAKAPEPKEEDDVPAEPKAKHPAEALGQAKSFPLDEFKRQYSNNDTPVAFKWFKEHYDPQEYSLWRADYKYPTELTQVFMSANLITGFHTRLEGSRKYIFGSTGVYGESNNSKIVGTYLIRGNNIQDIVNVAPDSESYEFTPLDLAKDEEFILGCWAWTNEVDGLKYADGKVMK